MASKNGGIKVDLKASLAEIQRAMRQMQAAAEAVLAEAAARVPVNTGDLTHMRAYYTPAEMRARNVATNEMERASYEAWRAHLSNTLDDAAMQAAVPPVVVPQQRQPRRTQPWKPPVQTRARAPKQQRPTGVIRAIDLSGL